MKMGVSWPKGARPFINQKHIDGPVLVASSGEMHWLTLWERLMVALGRDDANSLERKHWPQYVQKDAAP
jgi:hypothetical protein